MAGADGRIDKKELAQLQKSLRDAPFHNDALHRELFIDIVSSDIEALVVESADVSKLADRAEQMKAILKKKLTSEEYQRFVGSMFIYGLMIARASGGGVLGLGDKVSEEERLALVTFAAIFEVDLGGLSKRFG